MALSISFELHSYFNLKYSLPHIYIVFKLVFAYILTVIHGDT